MTRTATIRLQALNAISLVSSTEETRYYLNGVLLEIEPRAVTYVATDGHRLAGFRHDLDNKEPDNSLVGDFIVPLAHCKPFKFTPKALLADPRAILSKEDDPALTLSHGANAVRFLPVDGTFPDWRRVVPMTVDGTTAQFDADCCASFKKLGELMGAGKFFYVAHNGAGPALVSYATDDLFGVLMPMRSTGIVANEPPAWIAARQAMQIAA